MQAVWSAVVLSRATDYRLRCLPLRVKLYENDHTTPILLGHVIANYTGIIQTYAHTPVVPSIFNANIQSSCILSMHDQALF